jgi:uncharacterized SAM-binding protein YcdF (DUF218 family)
MFFAFSKMLHFILNPLCWVELFAVLAWIKHDKLRKRFLIISASLFLFFGLSIPLQLTLSAWNFPVNYKNDVTKNYKVGIVLGGFLQTDIKNLTEFRLSPAGNRLFKAVELYKAGRVEKLLISGGSGSFTVHKFKEGKIARDFLVQLGIDSNDILYEEVSRNTNENAIESKRVLLANYNVIPKEIILFTSGVHMRRSVKCYEKQGINCDTFTVDGSGIEGINWYAPENYLLPDGCNYGQWQWLLHEIVGYGIYWIKGYC